MCKEVEFAWKINRFFYLGVFLLLCELRAAETYLCIVRIQQGIQGK